MGWSLAAPQSNFDRAGRCGDGSRVGSAGILGRALAASPFPRAITFDSSHLRRALRRAADQEAVRPDVHVHQVSSDRSWLACDIPQF